MCAGDDEQWMRKAIEVARSKDSDPASSPLGCVIVLDGKIIAAERNQTYKLPDATAYAEMMAIRRACESIGKLELRGATLYSTLQPCGMCTMASIWLKVRRVVNGAGRDDVHRMYSRRSMSTRWASPPTPTAMTSRSTAAVSPTSAPRSTTRPTPIFRSGSRRSCSPAESRYERVEDFLTAHW